MAKSSEILSYLVIFRRLLRIIGYINGIISVNKDDFIAMIDQHRGLIYKVCRAYCRDPQAHQDLEQDILLQLWRAMPRFDGRVQRSTWIYRIALNTAISFYRKDRRRRQEVPLSTHLIAMQEEGGDDFSNEQMQHLDRFIQELGKNDKAIILLYLDGKQHKEIAGIMGISQTNVATKISRIKQKLKNRFSSLDVLQDQGQ